MSKRSSPLRTFGEVFAFFAVHILVTQKSARDVPQSFAKTSRSPQKYEMHKPIWIMRQASSSFILALITVGALTQVAAGQSHVPRKRVQHGSICGNPTVACKTTAIFQPNDLPFRVPEKSVIFDTELFYAIVLKSVPADEGDCNVFVPEAERLEAQGLFPDHKVFSSRCADIENLFYTNVSPKFRIMAVYAGTTLAEANRVLAAVKATGKFSGAYMRRMRTGFNGT